MCRLSWVFGVLLIMSACGEPFSAGGGGSGGSTTSTGVGAAGGGGSGGSATSTGVGAAGGGGQSAGAGPQGGAPTGAGNGGDGATAGGANGGAGGSGGNGEAGAGVTSGCPNSAPESDEPCSPVGLECSYGLAMDLDCREAFLCTASGFDQLGLGDCLDAPLSCPMSPPAGTGVQCAISALDKACLYGDPVSYCWCTDEDCSGTNCLTLTPPEWRCFYPPDVGGCPAMAPNLGTPCSQAGLRCDYLSGPCWAGHGIECTAEHIWQRVIDPSCIG